MKNYSYFTNPERIDIFAEFEVEAGKTNYIGALQVTKSYAGNAPVFRVSDRSEDATAFFNEHYADKTAPMQVKLAKKVSPKITKDDLDKILRRLKTGE